MTEEQVVEKVARALARRHGLGDHMSCEAWMKQAKVAVDATISALSTDKLREALIDTAASLAAAISLLERGGKAAKKAAPSDKMFDQMVVDYRASLERARAALNASPAGKSEGDTK